MTHTFNPFATDYSLFEHSDEELLAIAVETQNGITASYIENPAIRRAAFAQIYY